MIHAWCVEARGFEFGVQDSGFRVHGLECTWRVAGLRR